MGVELKVIETLEQVCDRLQIAIVIGSVPNDNSGNINIIYANISAATLFGYSSPRSLEGLDVRSLMPNDISKNHQSHVSEYVKRANGGKVRQSSIMGSWRELNAIRADGKVIPVKANVADIRNTEERYFVATFIDMTDSIEKEKKINEQLTKNEKQQKKLEEALNEANRLKEEAHEARALAEDGLLKQKRLTGQISLLRQIFAGTVGLIIMLGMLIAAQWATGTTDLDGLAMIERVLLVLTGILGSAMASVFDSRNKDEP